MSPLKKLPRSCAEKEGSAQVDRKEGLSRVKGDNMRLRIRAREDVHWWNHWCVRNKDSAAMSVWFCRNSKARDDPVRDPGLATRVKLRIISNLCLKHKMKLSRSLVKFGYRFFHPLGHSARDSALPFLWDWSKVLSYCKKTPLSFLEGHDLLRMKRQMSYVEFQIKMVQPAWLSQPQHSARNEQQNIHKAASKTCNIVGSVILICQVHLSHLFLELVKIPQSLPQENVNKNKAKVHSFGQNLVTSGWKVWFRNYAMCCNKQARY